MSRIVVGVIDTPAARMALRWASRMAREQGIGLEVVTAFELPPVLLSPDSVGDVSSAMNALESAAKDTQYRVIEEELGEQVGELHLDRQVIEGDPAPVLIASSRGAQLLVVGRRRRRFRRLGGSISRECANSAECPVVMVRAEMKVRSLRPRPRVRRP